MRSSVLVLLLADRTALEAEWGVGREPGVGLVDPEAAGAETVARRLVGGRDEQRRQLEVARDQAGLAQPARGADRVAGLVQPQPAAEYGALAGRVDADMGRIAAGEGAGVAGHPPFERHRAIEPGVVGRDTD